MSPEEKIASIILEISPVLFDKTLHPHSDVRIEVLTESDTALSVNLYQFVENIRAALIEAWGDESYAKLLRYQTKYKNASSTVLQPFLGFYGAEPALIMIHSRSNKGREAAAGILEQQLSSDHCYRIRFSHLLTSMLSKAFNTPPNELRRIKEVKHDVVILKGDERIHLTTISLILQRLATKALNELGGQAVLVKDVLLRMQQIKNDNPSISTFIIPDFKDPYEFEYLSYFLPVFTIHACAHRNENEASDEVTERSVKLKDFSFHETLVCNSSHKHYEQSIKNFLLQTPILAERMFGGSYGRGLN